MTDYWILQNRLFGLGNFINLTPTIQLLAEHMKKPVPVYFDLKFVEDCFVDCDFIEILDERPDHRELFGSGMVNFRNGCPDYLHVYKEVASAISLSGELGHTYVDECSEILVPKYNTLFIRGSGSEDKYYVSLKMPHDEYYEHYFARNLAGNYTQAFAGSENDVQRANGLFDEMTKHTAGIRYALALIRRADFIVSNDSGLAHAAAAMNKNMTILWKNTSLPKNANPNPNCRYRMCH